MKYALFGNCQATALRWPLECCKDFSSLYSFVELAPSYELSTEDAEDFCTNILPDLDLLIMQPHSQRRGHWHEHAVISAIAAQNNVKTIKFPQIHFAAYNPFEFLSKTAPAISTDDEFVYTDSLMVMAILSDITADEYSGMTRSGHPNKRQFARDYFVNTSRTMMELEHERGCDVVISDLLIDQFPLNRMMHNLNHPTETVMATLANRVLSLIDPGFSVKFDSDLFPDHDTEIYPFLAQELGLQFEPTNAGAERYARYESILDKASPQYVETLRQEILQKYGDLFAL